MWRIEFADSFRCGPHKWLLVNNGCRRATCSVSCYQNSKWFVDSLGKYKQAINENSDKFESNPELRLCQISTDRPFGSLRFMVPFAYVWHIKSTRAILTWLCCRYAI